MSEPRAINVRILHGDLRQATYPVVVGHYVGDVIVRAEAGLDRRSTERCAGVSIWGFILRGSASRRSSSVVAFRQERLSLGSARLENSLQSGCNSFSPQACVGTL